MARNRRRSTRKPPTPPPSESEEGSEEEEEESEGEEQSEESEESELESEDEESGAESEAETSEEEVRPKGRARSRAPAKKAKAPPPPKRQKKSSGQGVGVGLEAEWKDLVEESALAIGRSAGNIKSQYISPMTISLQLSALGRNNAKDILALSQSEEPLEEDDRDRVGEILAKALTSSKLDGKAGPKAALSAVNSIYGSGVVRNAPTAKVKPVAYKVGDPVPKELLESFVAWSESGVQHKTMVKYANEMRKIFENSFKRGFGLRNGMSLLDAFEALRESKADKESGRWASAGLLKFLSYVGVETTSHSRSKQSSGTSAAANVKMWLPRYGQYPPLRLADGGEVQMGMTKEQLRMQRKAGRQGGILCIPFVLSAEYRLHDPSIPSMDSFTVIRTSKHQLQAKMIVGKGGKRKAAVINYNDDSASDGSGFEEDTEEEQVVSEEDSEDDYRGRKRGSKNKGRNHGNEYDSKGRRLPPPPPTLPGENLSFDLVVPKPVGQERLLGDLLACYAQIQAFGEQLKVSNFSLEQLMCAIVCPRESVLLSEIHVCMLREAKREALTLEIQAVGTTRFDHHLLCWLTLDTVVWPELLRRYAEQQSASDDPYISEIAESVERNLRTEYWLLPAEAKVEALRFLCDSVLSLEACEDALEMGSARSLRPLGHDQQKNRYWLVGGHIFREQLESGVFFRCTTSELSKWQSLRSGGSSRERNLAKKIRAIEALVSHKRLPETMMQRFAPTSTTAAAIEDAAVAIAGDETQALQVLPPKEGSTSPTYLVHGLEFNASGFKNQHRVDGPFYGQDPPALCSRFDVRSVVPSQTGANNALMLEQTREKLLALETVIPFPQKEEGWESLREAWCDSVRQAFTGAQLSELLLKLEEYMKRSALNVAWHASGGVLYEAQQKDVHKILDAVFLHLDNQQLNAFMLAHSAPKGKAAKRSHKAGEGRGRGRPRGGGGRGRGRGDNKGRTYKGRGKGTPWYYIGRQVKDFFEGHGEFIGNVISVQPNEDPWIYKIQFEDGDIQEYDIHELRAIVLPLNKNGEKKADADRPESPQEQKYTTTKSGRRSLIRDSDLVRGTDHSTGVQGRTRTAPRRVEQVDYCSFPGCDGSGHRLELLSSHRSVWGCPRATPDFLAAVKAGDKHPMLDQPAGLKADMVSRWGEPALEEIAPSVACVVYHLVQSVEAGGGADEDTVYSELYTKSTAMYDRALSMSESSKEQDAVGVGNNNSGKDPAYTTCMFCARFFGHNYSLAIHLRRNPECKEARRGAPTEDCIGITTTGVDADVIGLISEVVDAAVHGNGEFSMALSFYQTNMEQTAQERREERKKSAESGGQLEALRARYFELKGFSARGVGSTDIRWLKSRIADAEQDPRTARIALGSTRDRGNAIANGPRRVSTGDVNASYGKYDNADVREEVRTRARAYISQHHGGQTRLGKLADINSAHICMFMKDKIYAGQASVSIPFVAKKLDAFLSTHGFERPAVGAAVPAEGAPSPPPDVAATFSMANPALSRPIANYSQRSQYKGVSWSRSSGKWEARIRVAGKQHYLGTYVLEEDAAAAYIEATKEKSMDDPDATTVLDALESEENRINERRISMQTADTANRKDNYAEGSNSLGALSHRICAGCLENIPKQDFSINQWRNKMLDARCNACTVRKVPVTHGSTATFSGSPSKAPEKKQQVDSANMEMRAETRSTRQSAFNSTDVFENTEGQQDSETTLKPEFAGAMVDISLLPQCERSDGRNWRCKNRVAALGIRYCEKHKNWAKSAWAGSIVKRPTGKDTRDQVNRLPKAVWKAKVPTTLGSKVFAYHAGYVNSLDWHPAEIVNTREETEGAKEILVHYTGWKASFDRWLTVESGQLRAIEDDGTHVETSLVDPTTVESTAEHRAMIRRAAKRGGRCILPFIPLNEYVDYQHPEILLAGIFLHKSDRKKLAGVLHNNVKKKVEANDVSAGGGNVGPRRKSSRTVKSAVVFDKDSNASRVSLLPEPRGTSRSSMQLGSFSARANKGPRNIFKARRPADIRWKAERVGWYIHRNSIPAAERQTFTSLAPADLKQMAKKGGMARCPNLKYEDGEDTLPVLRLALVWRRQVKTASTLAAVMLQCRVLHSCFNPEQMKMSKEMKKKQAQHAKKLAQRQAKEAKEQNQVRKAVERLIVQVEKKFNIGKKQQERDAQIQQRRAALLHKKQEEKKKQEVTYEYIGFAQMDPDMYVEIEWRNESEDDGSKSKDPSSTGDGNEAQQGENGEKQERQEAVATAVWYPAFVRSASAQTVVLYYPDGGWEESLTAESITAGMVRRPSSGMIPSAPWIIDQGDVEQEQVALQAIKVLPIPEREKLVDSQHEIMMTVFETVKYLADGYGRSRSRYFNKLPSRQDYPDYFETIEKPMCLNKVEKKILTAVYKSIDAFETDMTLIFENTRQFFEQGCEQYADIEIMQTIFWEALGAVESGQTYQVAETAGEFQRQRKKKFKLPPPQAGGALVPMGSPRGAAAILAAEIKALEETATALQAKMLSTWTAIRNQKDKHYNERALAFVEMPSRKEYPDYYKLIKKPMDLSTVYSKLKQNLYEEWGPFEQDMQLIFRNARQYNRPGSDIYENAAALDALLRKLRPSEEKERKKAAEKESSLQYKELQRAEKKARSEEDRAARELAKAAAKAGKSRETLLASIQQTPSLQLQLSRVCDVVCGLRDTDGRMRAELFMQLPEKTEAPPLPVYPKPLTSAPTNIPAGQQSKTVNGVLPNMAKQLPTEKQVCSWDRPSQEAFWEQRRAFYNRMKMTELQRECRKRQIWPGGDQAQVKDRLMRLDFCRSELLLEFEERTEEQVAEIEGEIGVVYYRLVSNPIDLLSIRQKIDNSVYTNMRELESDMLLLFNNARKFDTFANDPANRFVTADADALQSAMKQAIREVESRLMKILKSNETIQRQLQAVDSLPAGLMIPAMTRRVSMGGSEPKLWTPEDDQMLRQLIETTGTGNWEEKARQLGGGRSGNAVSHHWRKLREDDAKLAKQSGQPMSLPQAAAPSESAATGSKKRKSQAAASVDRGSGQKSAKSSKQKHPPPAPLPSKMPALPSLPPEEPAALQKRMAGALGVVRDSKDGRRKRSLFFEELPSRKDYPDYFQIIKKPIDLQTIAARVSAVGAARASSGRGYGKWLDFEDDMLRLFANAKLYNSEDSMIYTDADAMEELFRSVSEASCRNAAAALAKKRPSSSAAATAASASSGSSNKKQKKKAAAPTLDAATKSLLLKAVEAGRACKDGRRRRAGLFEELPDRQDYPEYYDVIKKPVSLAELIDRVQASEYSSIDAFKRDAKLLVTNAETFNMPESDICDDARAIVAAIEGCLKAKGGRR